MFPLQYKQIFHLSLMGYMAGTSLDKPFQGRFVVKANLKVMGFIKHALIGIAIYEAVKYCIRNEHMFRSGTISDDLGVAADPNVSLTGNAPLTAPDDPWKNSLASDELRAPDS